VFADGKRHLENQQTGVELRQLCHLQQGCTGKGVEGRGIGDGETTRLEPLLENQVKQIKGVPVDAKVARARAHQGKASIG